MNKLIFVLLLVAQSAFAITGNKVWRVPSGGSLPTWGPVNLADNTNAVTGLLPLSNMPAVNKTIGSSSGNCTAVSASSSFSTFSTANITTSGRPVLLFVQSDGTTSGNLGLLCTYTTGVAVMDCNFRIRRDGTLIYQQQMSQTVPSGVATGISIPGGALIAIDASPSAAAHSYTAELNSPLANTGAQACSVELVAIEL